MSRYLRQNDGRWGRELLGEGKSTIGGAGCLLVTCCEAVRELLGTSLRPDDFNWRCKINKVFKPKKSGAPPATLAKAAGLVVDERRVCAAPTHTTLEMRDVILEALTAGGRVIAWVDHDSGKANGDAEGDHFVLITRIDGEDFIYIDPVTGEPERLMRNTLTGSATWRKPKTRGPDDAGDIRTYIVRAVWPLYAPGAQLPRR